MISVRSNVTSLYTQRNLNRTQTQLSDTIAKLSSGYRINKASDDAAGLAISEKLEAEILSYEQAARNANDAISLVQTAESGMDDISGMLARMRELAMQSASDGVADTERAYIQVEIDEVLAEIDRISANTEFNGVLLLDGSLSADFQIGLDSGDAINIGISPALTTAGLGVGGLDLSTKTDAISALVDIDTALDNLNSLRSQIGATENRLEVIINNIGAQHQALTATNSRIRDVDVASESANMTSHQILMQSGSAMLAQANSIPQVALQLIGGGG